MRPESQVFHNDVLQHFNNSMYLTLLYRHHIVTETPASYQFEDKDCCDIVGGHRGYFALKEVNGQKMKYFIEEQYYQKLPIRINATEEMFFKEGARKKSVILSPTEITPFRIKPERCFADREFFDTLAPFQHSNPDHWTLSKICAVMADVGQTFIGVCGHPELGKTSIYLTLDALNGKSPVFQPRSVPGVLKQITTDGNMVFDDIHAAPGDVKKIMENFSFHVAGNAPIYRNGALKSKNTKELYDVSQQSITYLYNEYSDYPNPEKSFWNRLWLNNAAMESRFLCLRFTGKLTEQFDNNFNVPQVAEDNRFLYIRLAKHLMYLKKMKRTNTYQRKYPETNHLDLKGRHKLIYNELTWGIDLYADSQSEYEKLVKILDGCITSYKVMLNPGSISVYAQPLPPKPKQVMMMTPEDSVNDSVQDKVMTIVNDGEAHEIASVLKETGIDPEALNRMMAAGDIFRARQGYIKKL